MDHRVIQTSTAQYPSDNGWLYYYCATCKPYESVCAASFDEGNGFDEQGYKSALDAFKARHPHIETLKAQWAQP